jgi:hypothetical protein
MRLLLLMAALLVPACGGDSEPEPAADAGYNCDLEQRDETFTAGMSRTGPGGYVFTLDDALPSPPAMLFNTMTVSIEAPGGGPAGAVILDVLHCMPDHGHGAGLIEPVVSAAEDGSLLVDHVYISMTGLWDFSLMITADEPEEPRTCTEAGSEPALDEVVFRFCVDG